METPRDREYLLSMLPSVLIMTFGAVALGAFLIPGPSSWYAESITHAERVRRVERVVGGPDALASIFGASRVMATRIKTLTQTRNDRIEQVLAGPIELTPGQRNQLITILSNPYHYGVSRTRVVHGCIPSPGLLFEFESPSGTLLVRVCFSCQMIVFGDPWGLDFNTNQSGLRALGSQLFPGNTGQEEID